MSEAGWLVKVDFPHPQTHDAGEVGTDTGLRFSESLSGYLGEGADFWEAYRRGRAQGRSARFWVSVSIPDLNGLLADPNHEAAMSGRVAVRGMGTASVEDGRLRLFCRREAATLLQYYLPFKKGGERYLLWGEKRLHAPRGIEAWRQMTTLYAELLRRGGDDREELLARGVLRIGPGQVLLQALSFRPLGGLNPLRFASDYVRFLSFSSREIRSAGGSARSAP